MANSLGLKNITPYIEDWFTTLGITSRHEFEKIGGRKTYLLILSLGHDPDDELRCRLLGAEQDLDWNIIATRENRRAKSRFADVDEP